MDCQHVVVAVIASQYFFTEASGARIGKFAVEFQREVLRVAEVFLAVFLSRHPNGESVRQIDFAPTVPGSFRPMFELLHF